MPAKKQTAFRLGPIDRKRLLKLAQKKETTKSDAVRYAIKVACEKEGIYIK